MLKLSRQIEMNTHVVLIERNKHTIENLTTTGMQQLIVIAR